MARFVQIIEYQTSRPDEIKVLTDNYRSHRMGSPDADTGSAPTRGMLTADKDRPGYYLNVVEFESTEAAMKNSGRPDTSEFAEQMMKLCDGPPKFYNLEVVDTWDR